MSFSLNSSEPENSESYPVTLNCGGRELRLDKPRVMGILNVTPDSFSDGGLFVSHDAALERARHMIEAGADIVDIGGESTRPGAATVSAEQEMERVVPIIEAICSRFDAIVSIDTSKPEVMIAAHDAGAGLINDVRALSETGALEAAVSTQLPVCLMHMQGQPKNMQQAPEYVDVFAEVCGFLCERRAICVQSGIAASQILFDPGFGFGKTLAHNLTLLRKLDSLCAEAPVLIGLSQKRMLGDILGDETVCRVTASVTAALLCVQRGASIVRVHDVEPTVHALAVQHAVIQTSNDYGTE